MAFLNRINEALHHEHGATVALLERLEHVLRAHGVNNPPQVTDRTVAQLLTEIAAALQIELERHFAFEENRLFAYLASIGAPEIGSHLTEDHVAIRPVASRTATLARAAQSAGFDEAAWANFRKLAQELCDRLFAHVQMEETSLLPLLDDAVDAETDAELYAEYVGNA